MEVRYRKNKLQRQYERVQEAQKAYGVEIARKYIQRINLLKAARDIREVIKLPGLRCHQLEGNRKGQWAINLTGFYRLIFTMEDERLNIAQIEEVSKHYDQ